MWLAAELATIYQNLLVAIQHKITIAPVKEIPRSILGVVFSVAIQGALAIFEGSKTFFK